MKKTEPLFHLTLIGSCVLCHLIFGQAYNTNWIKSIELVLAKSWALAKR